MSTYTVQEIVSREEKPKRNGGTFTKYMLSLVNEGEVQLADFNGVNPQPGQALEGYEIRDEGFGPELKKAGSAPRANGKKPGGKSPEEQKSITRQGAEQRAALYLIAKAMVKQHLDQDLTREDFKKLCDWFVEDATA